MRVCIRWWRARVKCANMLLFCFFLTTYTAGIVSLDSRCSLYNIVKAANFAISALKVVSDHYVRFIELNTEPCKNCEEPQVELACPQDRLSQVEFKSHFVFSDRWRIPTSAWSATLDQGVTLHTNSQISLSGLHAAEAAACLMADRSVTTACGDSAWMSKL